MRDWSGPAAQAGVDLDLVLEEQRKFKHAPGKGLIQPKGRLPVSQVSVLLHVTSLCYSSLLWLNMVRKTMLLPHGAPESLGQGNAAVLVPTRAVDLAMLAQGDPDVQHCAWPLFVAGELSDLLPCDA